MTGPGGPAILTLTWTCAETPCRESTTAMNVDAVIETTARGATANTQS